VRAAKEGSDKSELRASWYRHVALQILPNIRVLVLYVVILSGNDTPGLGVLIICAVALDCRANQMDYISLEVRAALSDGQRRRARQNDLASQFRRAA
jgi:hypothetical protein